MAHAQHVVEARRRLAALVTGGHTTRGDQSAPPPDEITQRRYRRFGERRLFGQDHGGELVNALLQGRLVNDQRVPAALDQHLVRGTHAPESYPRRARGRRRLSVAVLCRMATSGTTTASRHHASRSMMNS